MNRDENLQVARFVDDCVVLAFVVVICISFTFCASQKLEKV